MGEEEEKVYTKADVTRGIKEWHRRYFANKDDFKRHPKTATGEYGQECADYLMRLIEETR